MSKRIEQEQKILDSCWFLPPVAGGLVLKWLRACMPVEGTEVRFSVLPPSFVLPLLMKQLSSIQSVDNALGFCISNS